VFFLKKKGEIDEAGLDMQHDASVHLQFHFFVRFSLPTDRYAELLTKKDSV
jgi:hypothetical protein